MFNKTIVTTISVLLLSINLLACGNDSPEIHIANAKNHIQNKEYNAAVIELKNAILKDKIATEPRVLLGEIYLSRGDYPSAEKELSTALRHGSDDTQIELLLARALLGNNDITAIEELVSNTDRQSLNIKSELLAINAIALMRNNNLDKARSVLSQAEALGFNGLYFNLAHAQLLAQKEQFDDSLTLLNKMRVLHPDNIEALLLTAHVLSVQSKYEQATVLYRKILDTSPDNANYKLYLAQALVKNEKYEEARPYIADILKIIPSHTVANDLQALIEYANSNFIEARRHAKTAIREGSNSFSSYVIAGMCAYLQNDYEDAYQNFKVVAPYLKDDHYLQQLYVASQFKIGKINEAFNNINDFDISNTDYNNFVTRMSLEFSSIGRNSDAMALADKAELHSTEAGQLRIGLVRAANNDQQGIKTLENILKSTPDQLEANIGLAYYHFTNGDVEKGEEVIDKWIASNNNDISALLLKGYISIKKEEYTLANSIFEKVLTLEPDNIKAKLSIAQIHALNDNADQSYNDTFTLAKQYPDNFTIAMFLYRFASQTDQVDKIISFYKDLLNNNQNNIKFRMLLARIYANVEQSDKGIELLEELPIIEQTADVWSLKTLLYFQLHEYRKAFQAAEKWVEQDRSSPEAYLRVVQLSELTKNFDKGIKYALDAEKIFIEQAYFPLMRATLLLLNQQPLLSQSVLAELPEKFKNTSYYLQLQSKIYSALEDYGKSVLFAEKRYHTYPSSITAKDLALAYIANDQYDAATALLKRRLKENPGSEGALHLLLAQIQNDVEPKAAVNTYLSILKNEPENVIALNNIAWLYINENSFENACRYALKAYNNAPNAPEIQDTYGYCLLKTGQHEASMAPLKMAYEGRSNNIDISFHYAESLILNNHPEKARRVLNRVNPVKAEHIEQQKRLYQQTEIR
ncbi:PEP-CTERM system TPR-repeat protein PrsT [Photobacterium gaetbulicola]|uniref:Uncharacterized protein n=1 Tax=Photobacterium gaetbulicola Gung47 TaxID=658445 RepID=A0A0C5WBQ7_9GAMM|nr:XrtA/PEP-CTERM system TPR-repeat protein PrsT [Photobacterium gaetbulicola]AJR09071.1 hypothetical protein H744_2c2408 [Photobacterium gaetbulicola Gung47]PSU04809.1 PEP-CTERM system TPR-repeat protein PrsT [Photobacterium gaetbulicola]